jgi:hypothetical protein
MRRLAVATAAGAVVALVAFTAYGGSSGIRRLPLHAPLLATRHLTGIVSGRHGSRLVRLNPSTFTVERAGPAAGGRGWGGWVRSPDGRRLAVATCRRTCNSFALHFGNASSLRWESGSVPLQGALDAAIWPSAGTLYALETRGSALSLVTIDPASKRVVTSRAIEGSLLQIARSADGLVLLTGELNEIVPARVVVIGADGSVRTVELDRILAGTHFDRQNQSPIGATNMPGLAVDPRGGVAYVVDPSGLIASVRLADLFIGYHQLGSGSLLTRLAGWLTPSAQAKDVNGTVLSAQWLGEALIAVAGSDGIATSQVEIERPTGLRIVDTRDWSAWMLDPNANTTWVGEGILLATGTTARYANTSHVHREGLVAYGSDGSLRWRLTGVVPYVVDMYGSRAILAGPNGYPLVDLATGRVIRKLPMSAVGVLLLGTGTASAY